MTALPLAAVALFLASSAFADKLLEIPVSSQQQAASAGFVIENGKPDARGCIAEKQFYQAVHDVVPSSAWNPSNPVSWYFGRNTQGLVEEGIMRGYAEASTAWNHLVAGLDFNVIAAPCLSEPRPRKLANCLNSQVRQALEKKDLHAVMGGDCKLYSATLVETASRVPAVVRQSLIVSGPDHAIMGMTILDAQGRTHEFLVDPLNDWVLQVFDADGQCREDESELGKAGERIEKASSATLP